MTNLKSKPRSGFTLVELLVVIAIIGVLIGMAVPAMQNMRELSRRSNCQYNLVQLSLAISNYEGRNEHLPIGTIDAAGPIQSLPIGYHHNWISGILPMMDQMIVYEAIDHDVSVYDPKNANVRAMRMPGLLCPSASDVRENTTCYAGVHSSVETSIDADNDGAFRLNTATYLADIKDGLSYTMFVGEKLSRFDEDLGWISGTRSSLRNTGHKLNADRARIRKPPVGELETPPLYVGGFASDHPSGLHVLMGDGSVTFSSNETDQVLLRQMAAIADGVLPPQNGSGLAPVTQ